MANIPVISMKGICKSFPGVRALQDIELELYKGDVLALMGENGAGKSTLMKVLAGAYQPDAGEILFEGEPVKMTTPAVAIDMGVNVIYQELNNSDVLSIAENIYMGDLKTTKAGLIDYKTIREDTARILKRVGLSAYDPFTPVGKLSVAEKQMVEIAKALAKNAKVLVLDEPTAALNNEEIELLFQLIRELSAEGTAIVYISHRLDEVFEISDRIMVMRDGQHIKTMPTAGTTKSELIALMVGREISNMYPQRTTDHIGPVVLEVENLSSVYVKDISFQVRRGEILGLFGLMGAGRTELVETIFGNRRRTGGRILIEGKEANIRSPRQAKEHGIGYIPAERKTDGLFLVHSVGSNITINILQKLLNRLHLLNYKKEGAIVDRWIRELRVKTPSAAVEIETLSGGNQQKVVLAKWLAAEPRILILNEPTRGIDVGAKAEIYSLINALSRQGITFIMVSSELPEVMSMSDRIVVIHEGRMKGTLTRAEFSQEKLLATALGGEN